MPPTNDVTAFVTALASLVLAVTGLVALFLRMRSQDLLGQGRVDSLWGSLLRRGRVEAAAKDHAAPRPGEELTLSPEARAAYEPIAPALRSLYAGAPPGTDAAALAELFERRYGDWLVKHICVPLGVHEMACIAMAVSVAREVGPPWPAEPRE